MSTREAKELLRQGFSRDLELAIFDLNKNSGGLVACKQCPRRSGNDMLLMHEYDGQDNVCTDVACFQAKTVRHIDQLVIEQKDEGFEVTRGVKKKHLVDGDKDFLQYFGVFQCYHKTVPAKKRIETNLRHVTDDGRVLVVYDIKKIIEHAQKLGKYNPPDDKASAARNIAGDAAKELWESTGRYVFTMRKRVHAEITSKTPQILAGGAEGLLPLLIKLILEQMDGDYLFVQSWFEKRYCHNGNFDPKSSLEAAHCLIDFVLSLEHANYQELSDWTREFPVLSDIADLMKISIEVSEADRIAAEKAAIPASEAA
jgi:hypothetical protein